ncbi:MAG: tRNA uridine-5-carboxymethylaminomethyl(34) synthesis GTPase MnmE, partial [Butyricicoccus sp.]
MNQLISRDTIAAQATASGEGGIAIVRLSGERCEEILLRVFRPKNGQPLKTRMLTFGHVMDGGQVVDEAMAVLFCAPHSYTREDVAEIHCHGSDALVRRILLLLLDNGARMARPGEFTCRAFLNGRIDLAQAEAVMRMIRAGSDRAMTSAIRQMEGGVSAFVRAARQEIVALLAEIAAAIDFPDEVEESETAQQVHTRCGAIRSRLLSSCDPRAGRIEDEGLRVVL